MVDERTDPSGLVVCPGTNRHWERCARRHPFRTNELCLWKCSFRKVSAQVRKGLLPYKSWRNPSSIHIICSAACWAFATNKLPAFVFVIKEGDIGAISCSSVNCPSRSRVSWCAVEQGEILAMHQRQNASLRLLEPLGRECGSNRTFAGTRGPVEALPPCSGIQAPSQMIEC